MSRRGARDAWVEALCGVSLGDTVLCLVTASTLAFLPLLCPQRRRRVPVVDLRSLSTDAYVRSPLVDNAYRSSRQQIVPTSLLVTIALSVPLGAQLLLSVGDAPRHRSAAIAGRFHSFIYAVAHTMCVVDFVKRFVGYWRPYFYDECGLDATTGECSKDVPDDAYRSFPSGHAGISMAALLHTSLCLVAASGCGAPRRVLEGSRWTVDVSPLVLVACLSPVFLAVFVAASRAAESDHWPADVVAGALIGGAFAVLFYARWFPADIFSADAARPRPPFLETNDPTTTTHDSTAGVERPIGQCDEDDDDADVFCTTVDQDDSAVL